MLVKLTPNGNEILEREREIEGERMVKEKVEKRAAINCKE